MTEGSALKCPGYCTGSHTLKQTIHNGNRNRSNHWIDSRWVIAVVLSLISKKGDQKAIEESNRQADLTIQEARLTAQRLTDEATTKAEKIVGKAEAENERIKQQKIQEAKERYAQMRSKFDTEKAEHKIQLKEMEVDIISKQKDLQIQLDAYDAKEKDLKNRLSDLEGKESELVVLRQNLEKQLKIVQRKKEELDAANEERIKALEKSLNSVSRMQKTNCQRPFWQRASLKRWP
ncbi:MAG: hypothetical protein R2792_17110 [Saprospiraceae bacterium]